MLQPSRGVAWHRFGAFLQHSCMSPPTPLTAYPGLPKSETHRDGHRIATAACQNVAAPHTRPRRRASRVRAAAAQARAARACRRTASSAGARRRRRLTPTSCQKPTGSTLSHMRQCAHRPSPSHSPCACAGRPARTAASRRVPSWSVRRGPHERTSCHVSTRRCRARPAACTGAERTAAAAHSSA